MNSRHAIAFAFLAAGLASSVSAAADTYPSRQISIVVPYPEGGPTDSWRVFSPII